jgi:hypothetical protein
VHQWHRHRFSALAARPPHPAIRVQSILDREIVAHQKTLEQKIAEQGPKPMRVDPHLIGLAIMNLLELNRLAEHRHADTKGTPWYANPGTKRLTELAPLYALAAAASATLQAMRSN